MLYYDPLDRACKSRIGAFARESETTFTIFSGKGGEDDFSADACRLLLRRDGGETECFSMTRTREGFTVTLRFHEIGLYFYRFAVGETAFGCGDLRRGELGSSAEWQITVFSEDYHTPDWFKGGVMYQIFPDRFRKCGDYPAGDRKVLRKWGETPYYRPNEFGQVLNNDFFGGNFNGIREKLDYLASLGVTAIYLNPIFEAFSNHRYDTGDYLVPDGLLGTVGDFEALVRAAEERGIRLILDGVFNHTGADSRYFNLYGRYPTLGAYQSPASPYADWYHFHPFPDEYDCWWGIKILPAVNESSESYQDFILGENGVIRSWLRRGAGGFRLDVADELPDFFVKKLRRAIKEERPDAIVIGEVWEDASNKIAYDTRREYFQGGELDSVMNYPLKDAIIQFVLTGYCHSLRNTLAALIDNYPPEALHSLMNILGTHDTPRILTVLGGKQCSSKDEMAVTRLSDEEKAHATALLKMAALLQFTLPGVPCVYYGDENGMEGYADPFCRGCYDWEHRNEALTDYYRALGAMRAACADVFTAGEYRELYADASCLVYARCGGRVVYSYVNRSASEYTFRFRGVLHDLLTGETHRDVLAVAPFSCGAFLQE